MAQVIFEGLTKKQAKTLAEWFEGQGEQECSVWFEAQNIPSPLTEVQRKGGYFSIDPNGDVVVYCYTPKDSVSED